jgi:hypothetical protein
MLLKRTQFYFSQNTPYNNLVMTIQDWASLIVAILTIVSSIAFAIKWLVKHYLAELKPNSGSSMKDQISRLEMRINEADATRTQMKEDHKVMKNKLDHMYDILIEYIAKPK